MKRLFGILNLILCLELIIGPNFPGLKIISEAKADNTTCPSGLVYDSTLNRCITSEQNAMLINATASCNGDKQCYKRLAEEELKKGEQEGKITAAVKDNSGLFNKVIGVAAIAAPLIAAYTILSVPKKCISTSMYAMTAGGVAQLAGHILTNGKHKKCLEKVKSDWEAKKTASAESTSTGVSKVSVAGGQSEAFEMLAQSEECMEKTAKAKGTFFAISAAAFAASAVLAGMEILRESNPVTGPAEIANNTCTVTASVDHPKLQETIIADYKAKKILKSSMLNANDLASFIAIKENFDGEVTTCASIDRYELLKDSFNTAQIAEESNLLDSFKEITRIVWKEANIFKVNSTEAQVVPFSSELAGSPEFVASGQVGGAGTVEAAGVGGAGAGTSTTVGGIRGFLIRPKPRLIISGVLAGWSAMMWMHTNKQARAAKNRAEYLRKLKDQFNDANGAISCTAEERSTSANANCYCYTDAGQRNTARANSQVCQQLFSGKSPGQSGDYNVLAQTSDRVCIAQNGSTDSKCSCAQTKSCLNAIPSGVTQLGAGAISIANAGLRPTNDIASGNVGAASISGAAAMNTAARILASKKDLDKKLKLDPNKVSKMTKDIEGALIAGGAGTPSPLLASSNLPMNMTPTQAAQALEKELGDAGRSFERVNGAPALATPGNATPGDSVDFSLATEQPALPSTESQLAEVMAQDLNYGQNDITKSDSNIFKILSNRYQRSGMRRLFDEEGKTKAEQANKEDISQ